jgi:hypothetical protein
MTVYEIIRCYKDDKRPIEIIKSGVTLEEAKEHCNNPDTQKEGEYFDAWRKE